MNKFLRKSFLVSAAVLFSLGLGANLNSVSAHRSHHYYRKVRTFRTRRHRPERRKVRRVHHVSNRSQMAIRTLHDVNRSRRHYGLRPLKETRSMNRLATKRAKQLINNFSHYNRNGQINYQIDARKMRIKLGNHSGENIANAGMGNENMEGIEYHPHNGAEMADMDHDSMMNHDAQSNWGHRRNILDPNFKLIGIGVRRSGSQYYLAEDFGR